VSPRIGLREIHRSPGEGGSGFAVEPSAPPGLCLWFGRFFQGLTPLATDRRRSAANTLGARRKLASGRDGSQTVESGAGSTETECFRCYPTCRGASSRNAMANDDTRTSATLLAKIRDLHDQAAWERFFAQYQPMILRWCARKHLQPNDAEEIAAAVLEKLVRKMPAFQYDPSRSFRAWLRTVVAHAVIDLSRGKQRPGARGNAAGESQDCLANIASPELTDRDLDDLAGELTQQLEREFLVAQGVSARVQQRVAAHVWQAFWLTAIEERTGQEVAEQLGIKVATVFVYKARVIKLLHQEAATGAEGHE
jgi:RNA polymerase sigma factor (sigma-70 family)